MVFHILASDYLGGTEYRGPRGLKLNYGIPVIDVLAKSRPGHAF